MDENTKYEVIEIREKISRIIDDKNNSSKLKQALTQINIELFHIQENY